MLKIYISIAAIFHRYASGDLAPLSHVALGLLGEGKMWSSQTGWADAADVSFSNAS